MCAIDEMHKKDLFMGTEIKHAILTEFPGSLDKDKPPWHRSTGCRYGIDYRAPWAQIEQPMELSQLCIYQQSSQLYELRQHLSCSSASIWQSYLR